MADWTEIMAGALGGGAGAVALREAFRHWRDRGRLDLEREKAEVEASAELLEAMRTELRRQGRNVADLGRVCGQLRQELEGLHARYLEVVADRERLLAENRLLRQDVTRLEREVEGLRALVDRRTHPPGGVA